MHLFRLTFGESESETKAFAQVNYKYNDVIHEIGYGPFQKRVIYIVAFLNITLGLNAGII